MNRGRQLAGVSRSDVGRPAAARTRTPAVVVAGLLLLAGCGSGQNAQTYQEKATADSTNDAIGDLAIRNLAVSAPTTGTTYPAGGSAPLTIAIVNNGGQPDVLVSASSPAAARVDVVGGPTANSPLPVPALGEADARYSLILRGLNRQLDTGTYIDVTLIFARNGSKKLQVPVAVTNSDKTLPQNNDYKVAETDSQGKPIGE